MAGQVSAQAYKYTKNLAYILSSVELKSYKNSSMKRNLLYLALSLLLSAFCAVMVSKHYMTKSQFAYDISSGSASRSVQFVEGGYPDFTYAAENSVNGVVHVKVLKREKPSREASILQHFFGYGAPYSLPRESVNSGSGVIISPDGYIVTNNHVVEGASQIEVTMNNNRSFTAKIIGTDPVTDIALLKVEADNLPSIPVGSSDNLRLGEWVLAIGSPYNLRSTITAGIVSAKGRSLPDMSGNFKIESFIQTDAAVNPGNSGGALVNVRGELVGINTAIASNTGSYTGYSFAVPTTIMQKVVADIKEFGSVQRAMLGISMTEMNQKLAEQAGINGDFYGVYVHEVERGGAADLSGMKKGDIIVAIDSAEVKNTSDIQEKINSYRPGDEVFVELVRDGVRVGCNVRLQGRESEVVSSENGDRLKLMGATLALPEQQLMKKLKIKKGVQVVAIEKGKFKDSGIKEGLVITHINQIPVGTPDEILQIVGKARRSVLVEGVYPNGAVYYYGVGV